MLLITKKRYKTLPVAGFDVETKEDGSFYCAVITFEDSEYQKPDTYKVFFNPRDCAEYLLKNSHSGEKYDCYRNGFLAGYNVAYDLNTLIEYFPVNRIEKRGRFITVDYTKNIYNEKYLSENNLNKYFKIVDLANFFLERPSLKSIASDFGEHYLDIHDYRDPRIVEACFTHSLCTRNIFARLQDIVNQRYKTDIRYTATSTARKIFTTNFLKHKNQIRDVKTWRNGKPIKYTKDELYGMKYFSRLAYHGGITEVFRKGRFENAVMIDKVSMYPYVMRNRAYPNPNHFRFHDDVNPDYFNNLEFKDKCGIAEVKIRIPRMYIPPFLFTYHDKIGLWVCGYGDIEGVYTYPEIEYAISLGARVLEVYQVLEFKTYRDFFDDYIDEFFTMKRDDSELKYFAKLMLNGLSGSFGQVNDGEIAYEYLDDGDVIDIEEIYEYNGVKFRASKSSEDESFPRFSYPCIIAYITAYARIELHKAIMKLKPISCLYCDTDSIITLNQDYDKVLKIGRDLDCWSVKWHGECEIRGLKYYRYRNAEKWIYKIKGIPDRYKEEFWNTENIWIKRPRHFRSAIRTGKRANEWIDVNYVRRNVKDKRVFNEDGGSMPYEFR